jgi:hypothetical protein
VNRNIWGVSGLFDCPWARKKKVAKWKCQRQLQICSKRQKLMRLYVCMLVRT